MVKKNNKKQRQKAKSDTMKNLTMITVIVLFLGLGVFALVQTFAGSDKEAEVVRVQEAIFEYETQPILGDPDAPVRIVEFGDYQCPSCKKFKDEIYPQLKKDYIDQGKVAFYYINNPVLGPDSYTAAMAAEAVYQQNPDSFWTYMETIYENQGKKGESWVTPEFLVKLAQDETPDVDADQLKDDLEKATVQDQVDKDRQIAIKAETSSVPTLFVNGRRVDAAEAFQYSSLKSIIDEAIEEAQ
jgi:protein-disulfide isomerase